MVETSEQDGRWWLELIVTQRPYHKATGAKLILVKAQFFTLNTAAERGTLDEMEATHQHAHNQRKRLEAEDCNRMHFGDNSFRVGGDAHHAASLTLAPQCCAFT